MDIQSTALMNQATSAYGANKNAMPEINKNANMREIRETAKEFEAVFIAEMLRPMFEGIETNGMFGGGQSEKIYRDMQIDEYGKALANSGGIGLAEQVVQEMIKMQEAR